MWVEPKPQQPGVILGRFCLVLQGTKKAQNILPVFGEHTDRPEQMRQT